VGIDLTLNTLSTVATFTAPATGTYVLEGTTTIAQVDTLLLGALATIRCAWFNGAGNTQLGPRVGESTQVQVSLVNINNEVTLTATAQTSLTASATATLRCTFLGAVLPLGGFEATSWSYQATRTA
jgi:hypothetical protein